MDCSLIVLQKIAAERRLEAAYERALLNKVLQNEVLGDVVHKLEWWKSGVQRSLQKFQPNVRSPFDWCHHDSA
eukprot:29562-Eustigmatos_ZCMA.PRE.1